MALGDWLSLYLVCFWFEDKSEIFKIVETCLQSLDLNVKLRSDVT